MTKGEGEMIIPDGTMGKDYERMFVDTEGIQVTSTVIPQISLRDWFAGQALMGILNNAESRIIPMKYQEDMNNAEILADNCYFMANAMLKAREKQP